MGLPVVNEDYELGCSDSMQADVDLSSCLPSCFTPTYANNVKANGKKTLTALTIAVTAATGSITTSVIDGETITFVSAAGTINGDSQNCDTNGTAFCLGTDQGSTGTLTVVGTNTQSGSTITDVCDIWFEDAGQDKVIMS